MHGFAVLVAIRSGYIRASFLESLRDGLLDFFFLVFAKGIRRMKTLRPDRLAPADLPSSRPSLSISLNSSANPPGNVPRLNVQREQCT
jgi:hypothetical protein